MIYDFYANTIFNMAARINNGIWLAESSNSIVRKTTQWLEIKFGVNDPGLVPYKIIILFYLCPSVLPSVQDIFRRIFLSNCWWQKSDIWSQASYRYTILWVTFLDPSDFYFLFADSVGFYTHWTYMHIFRHIFLSNWQKSDIWSQASYRYPISSIFGPVRSLLPVCRLSWFLYTLNIYAHFSSHLSLQLLMAEIWYLVTSLI